MMIEINFSSSFKRAFKKLIKGNPNVRNIFWQKVAIFIKNPFHQS